MSALYEDLGCLMMIRVSCLVGTRLFAADGYLGRGKRRRVGEGKRKGLGSSVLLVVLVLLLRTIGLANTAESSMM